MNRFMDQYGGMGGAQRHKEEKRKKLNDAGNSVLKDMGIAMGKALLVPWGVADAASYLGERAGRKKGKKY